MNRRRFCELVAGTTAAVVARSSVAQVADSVTLQVGGTKGRQVPAAFTGLSYELAQLTEPSFFSPEHRDLVALFRCLSPSGILRIGGNTSEFSWIKVDAETAEPRLHTPRGDLAENWMPHRLFAVPGAALDSLAGFLRVTGWKTIFGLNFGNSTPERAAAEAAFVAGKLGDRLAFFQIGNEPDFYRDANNGTRPPGWGFEDYVREWLGFANAISARVASARFGGPDTGASSDWVTRFGTEIAPRLGQRLVALTGHYYAEGPPNDPRVTTARLLAGDPKVRSSTEAIMQVADAQRITYHMTEGNSCYRGGKPGMSNAFAASLWGADYLLLLASLGCAGVNLHGGDSRFLSAGLGDHNPGLKAAGGQPQAAPNGFYTPIASEQGQPATARPLFYGMLLAQQFAGSTMLSCDLAGAPPHVTAYAAEKNGKRLVCVINKGVSENLNLRLVGGSRPIREARAWYLRGPSLDATSGVTLGDAAVDSRGHWTPRMRSLATEKGTVRLQLPASAALLFLD